MSRKKWLVRDKIKKISGVVLQRRFFRAAGVFRRNGIGDGRLTEKAKKEYVRGRDPRGVNKSGHDDD